MKKVISILLIVALSLSMGTIAFADDAAYIKYEEKADALISNSTFLDEAQSSEVKEELAALEQVSIPIESLFDVSLYNGEIVYHRTVYEDVVNYITVDESSNGDVIVDYYEGELHDTITYCLDGSILLNGEPVVVTMSDGDSTYEQHLATRSSLNDTYSTTPFSGTQSGDYTVLDKIKYGNLKLQQKIIETVTSALCDLLTRAIEKVLPDFEGFVASSVVKTIFNALCSNIKTEAQRMATNSNAVGYKVVYMTTDFLVAPLCYCYRHDFDFYLCEVNANYLPSNMHCGSRSIYHQFTLFW